jgi:major membrane immunogen (membrane-anchored lipoprotein)
VADAASRGIAGNLKLNVRTSILLLCAAAALSACSSSPKGVRVTNDGTSAFSAKEGEKIRNLSANDVKGRIVGKTFQYTRSDGNGFVTYNADGTFDYQDDTRGEGKGRWSATGDQYCETFGPGAQQECGIFKTTGDAYFAANSRLVEMKV